MAQRHFIYLFTLQQNKQYLENNVNDITDYTIKI